MLSARRRAGEAQPPHLGQRLWTESLQLQAPTSPRHTPGAQTSGLSPVPLAAPPRSLATLWGSSGQQLPWRARQCALTLGVISSDEAQCSAWKGCCCPLRWVVGQARTTLMST
jgi:hypothetical protein